MFLSAYLQTDNAIGDRSGNREDGKAVWRSGNFYEDFTAPREAVAFEEFEVRLNNSQFRRIVGITIITKKMI
jgi:hypothetical protein